MKGRERLCLDLFSGLGGFSSAFRDADEWKVVTVDLDPEERFDPNIRSDIRELGPGDLPDADVILAGHPCTVFSKAAAWQDHWDENDNPQTDKAREHVAMLFHTVGLIRALAPRYWFLENPEGHMRRFLGRPTGSVTYCQYGADHRKPTDLWGDHPPMEYRRCSNGDPCHESRRRREKAGDEHPADTLPRDPAERSKVPYELSKTILEAVEGRVNQTQATLIHATDGGTSGVASTDSERQEAEQ